MIISLSGDPGSGKSTVAKLLSERLGYKRYSMGDLRGRAAVERGITIDQLNALGENDPTTDSMVDEYQMELGKSEDDFIVDGRLSWHFIPQSFKVMLRCDALEAGRRIYEAKKAKAAGREDEIPYKSPEDAAEKLAARVASDNRRYAKYYGVDATDEKNYDLVVNTTNHKRAEETVEDILKALRDQGKIA